MDVTPEALLNILVESRGKPLSGRQILSHFKLSRDQRQHALQLLDQMAEEGVVRRARKGLYALPKSSDLMTGTVSVHRQGYGFVVPDDGQRADVFIPARFMREVMNGDRVRVSVRQSPRGGVEGRVVRVLERAHRQLVGRWQPGPGGGAVVPIDPALSRAVVLSSPPPADTQSGFLVVAAIQQYPDRRFPPRGTVVEVLGDPKDPKVEILAVAHKYDLPREFCEAALNQARTVAAEISPEDLNGREDLRNKAFVTIDGETAKDFDDAVAVRREAGGQVRLWVAIADVGHYVAPDTPLDRDALERGTSVYFPGTCLPMLPESLSNGICSLQPEVDRLVFVAEMVFDSQGQRKNSRFYPGIICSKARLTYTQVAAVLAGKADPAAKLADTLLAELSVMEDLAGRLQKMRMRRGSLDFDLPEPEIVLDLQGRPDQILRAERTVAHRIIEEFMLAANEAVATYLADRHLPVLYRIHEPPDMEKLQAFQSFLGHFNIGLVLDEAGVRPEALQEVLETVRDRPEERMVNQLLLRSMRQARYSADNPGHFGLASSCYCHFTSPIRRYPDLVIHRMLRQALAGHGKPLRVANLEGLGELLSQKERRAMEAEREIVALKRCQFMQDKVGSIFEACVADVQPFGFFVELVDVFVEGLVHVATLTDDYYEFDEELHRLVGQRRRRLFRIGDTLKVRLVRVDLDRRELDFELADMASKAPSVGVKGRKNKKQR